jgi:hypothetical protein
MSALWSAAGTVVPALTLTLALPEKHGPASSALTARWASVPGSTDDEASHRHDAYR